MMAAGFLAECISDLIEAEAASTTGLMPVASIARINSV
jgi:hypothetical protein